MAPSSDPIPAHSGASTAGVKLPVLFFLSLLVCFPAFFIVQYVLEYTTMKIAQMAAIILSGFVLTAAICRPSRPSSSSSCSRATSLPLYIRLLHVAIFVIAGPLFGMKAVLNALRFSCEQKGIYPKTGVVVFRFWVVILAFVGIQLAWNLRPFLAHKDEPYALPRNYEGNFYTAVIYSISSLTEPTPPPLAPSRGPVWLGPDSTAKVK